MRLHPDNKLRCLLIHTRFSENSYWNYRVTCSLVGAKSPSAPLGLITVAALLPQHWEFRLLDLNARDFSRDDWAWADIVVIGGMLPQQLSMLEYIRKAKAENKFVVVGGADPSSQPELYRDADALMIGEGEDTIPQWLESWRLGSPSGTFKEKKKPDVTKSPIPRFDLLNVKDYLQIGIQFSRGCPFNCEFCDIIELFGRVPRAKTVEQILAELQCLYDLGYRGSVEFVDDNFIGNKRFVKRQILPALIAWQRERGYPFFFHTEASMNLADDRVLLRLMRAAEFRFVFIGIESPDPETLLKTQKSQNTMGDIAKRIQVIYDYGLVILGGFIMGFDGEKKETDIAMVKLIEDANVAIAMVGLLVALPNTQLTRRLRKEGRLLSMRGEKVTSEKESSGNTQNAFVEVVDQTTAGLNFETARPRIEILEEYKRVVSRIYNPNVFANRVLRVAYSTKFKPRHFASLHETFRQLNGLRRMIGHYLSRPTSRWAFAKVFFLAAIRGPFKLEIAMKLMGIYLHLEKQTEFVLNNISHQIEKSKQLQHERAGASSSSSVEAFEPVTSTIKVNSPRIEGAGVKDLS